MIRSYKYAIKPTLSQKNEINRVLSSSRKCWNEMVALMNYAEKEYHLGHAGSLVKELASIVSQKKVMARAISVGERLAQEKGISVEEALFQHRNEKAQNLLKMIVSKKNGKLRKRTKRKLAIKYAIERAQFNNDRITCPINKTTYFALVKKFTNCGNQYIIGKKGKPHFKKFNSPVTLEFQVTNPTNLKNNKYLKENIVNLSLLGGQILRNVEIKLHRPLPINSIIKNIILSGSGERMFVVFNIEVEKSVIQKNFKSCNGKIVGIDPGRKVAFSLNTPDGLEPSKIQPEFSKDKKFLKKVRKLQRKIERERRANNPDAYGKDGQYIRGKSLKKISGSMKKNLIKLAEMHRHIADSRENFYHLESINLLNKYDNIKIGNWRGKTGKDYDHALSTFTAILKDKANLSVTPKNIESINEKYTTQTCPNCGEKTGPKGVNDLNIRNWICSNCGKTHDRDYASATNIARCLNTAEAHSVSTK